MFDLIAFDKRLKKLVKEMLMKNSECWTDFFPMSKKNIKRILGEQKDVEGKQKQSAKNKNEKIITATMECMGGNYFPTE